MGKKHRRKQQARHGGAAFHRAGPNPGPGEPADEVRDLLGQAMVYLQREDLGRFDERVVSLAARCGRPSGRSIVTSAIRQSVDERLRQAWEGGWQPADVHRMAMRRSGKPAAQFVLRAMLHELHRYAGDSVPPDWTAQLSDLHDGPTPTGDPITASRDAGMDWLEVIEAATRSLYVLAVLPPIEKIGPLPGEWTGPVGTADSGVDDRILNRVRMLLAKAESTPYEAEAETFTAGAASLIARHRISEAMIAAAREDRATDGAACRRIGIDNPYESPKVQLLDAIAQANSCRVVWSQDFGFATVIGFPSDLSGVELLYTSLLLQATNTMTATGRRAVQGAHQRSRSFRASFLTSFALRIGERLREAAATEERSAAATVDGLKPGARLPALIDREQDVTDAVNRMFPQLVRSRARSSYDAAGWQHGRQAADQADMRSRAELR